MGKIRNFKEIGGPDKKIVIISWKFKGGSFLTLNYTYQDTEDDLNGERLPDVPAHKGNLLFNYRISRYFNFYTGLFLKDSMPRAKGDTRSDVSGYGIVNMGFTKGNCDCLQYGNLK